MALKKLFRITLHAPPDLMHDIMLMGGKGGVEIVDVQPIRHGGENEKTGELKAPPRASDVVTAYAATVPQFTTQGLISATEHTGVTKGALYQAILKLQKQGTLKRIGPATYTVTGEQQTQKQKQDGRKGPREIKAGSEPEVILAFIRSKQNGGGEGIPKREIAAHLRANGHKASNLARALSNLLKRKEIVRVAKNSYRVEA